MGRRGRKFLEEETVIKKKSHIDRVVLVSREDWRAKPPKEPLPPVVTPVQNVVVTWTETDACEWPAACMKACRDIQTDHMENRGLPDIRYNFLIGLDKQVYEGRGWGMAGPTYPETIQGADQINGKSIEIAIIDTMKEPIPDYAETIIRFLAKEMVLKTGTITKPLEFKGIMNNRFVRFSKLFEGEKVGDFMLDEVEKAAQEEMEKEIEVMVEERMKEVPKEDEEANKLIEEMLAEQRAEMKGKSEEELKKEYGFTQEVDPSTLPKGIPEELPEEKKKELKDLEIELGLAPPPET